MLFSVYPCTLTHNISVQSRLDTFYWWELFCRKWHTKVWICCCYFIWYLRACKPSFWSQCITGWANSSYSSTRAKQREKSQHIYWFKICLFSITCPWKHLERKKLPNWTMGLLSNITRRSTDYYGQYFFLKKKQLYPARDTLQKGKWWDSWRQQVNRPKSYKRCQTKSQPYTNSSNLGWVHNPH